MLLLLLLLLRATMPCVCCAVTAIPRVAGEGAEVVLEPKMASENEGCAVVDHHGGCAASLVREENQRPIWLFKNVTCFDCVKKGKSSKMKNFAKQFQELKPKISLRRFLNVFQRLPRLFIFMLK